MKHLKSLGCTTFFCDTCYLRMGFGFWVLEYCSDLLRVIWPHSSADKFVT